MPLVDFIFRYSDLAAAIIDFTIAAVVILQVRQLRIVRFRNNLLVSLVVVFFVLRGVQRLNDVPGIFLNNNHRIESFTDILAIILLVYILASVSKLVAAVLATYDESQYRAIEYQRARKHYEQVVRHRMFNPLAVIKGSAQTLEAGTVTDAAIHQQLCQAIIDMAHEIEYVTLEPEPRDALEEELDAVAHVD